MEEFEKHILQSKSGANFEYENREGCWKMLDKDGTEMSDDWAVTPRTYDKVKRLLDRLNVNGEYRPYTMVKK